MTVIKKATIKAYDAAAHKATVQIAGSLGVWLDGVRVATDIPAADVVAGRQCAVLFLDPSNQDDAVVITVQGALPSGGGVSDHGALTGLGDDDHPQYSALAQAETVAALWTFNAGLKLAASQQIQDSSGTGRILLATTDPNITLTGSTRINSNVGIDSAPVLSPDTKLAIQPSPTVAGEWRGVDIVPTITFSGSGRVGTGLVGIATAVAPAATTGHTLYGLNFTVAGRAGGDGAGFASLIGAVVKTQPITIIGTWTISTMAGLNVQQALTAFGGALTVTEGYMIKTDPYTSNAAQWSVTTMYGLRIGDITGSAFGTVRLLEVGPSSPYLRVVGKWTGTANQTPVYICEGFNATLRQVQWKDGASIAAGDRVMVLV